MTPSPEKSVVQEAEALLDASEQPHRDAHADNWDVSCLTCVAELALETKSKSLVRELLAEQHRLEAENRSLREALREIGQEAMLAASDPHLSAADYRKALREVCNLALVQEDSRNV